MVGGIWSNKVGDPSSPQLAIKLAFALEGKGGELAIRAIGLGGRWEWGLLVKVDGGGVWLGMPRSREMWSGVRRVEGGEVEGSPNQESGMRQYGLRGGIQRSPRKRGISAGTMMSATCGNVLARSSSRISIQFISFKKMV